MKKARFVGDLSEDDLIRLFFLPVANGALDDDVARVLVGDEREWLVSTDSLVEDVHFLRRSPAFLVGRKAVGVNLSDIVASGGDPRWATLSVNLPKQLPIAWVRDFAEGFRQGLTLSGCQLIGGDTGRSPDRIALNVTVIGAVEKGKSIPRSGAREGDWIGVTGFLGDSSLGLSHILGQGSLDDEQSTYFLNRHFCPPFHRSFAQAAAATVTSMMDLSDGILTDLPRLCQASGVRGELELSWIPISPAALALGLTPDQAVQGGEDYELLFTLPPKAWSTLVRVAGQQDVQITRIGTVHGGQGLQIRSDGRPVTLRSGAWQHFG